MTRTDIPASSEPTPQQVLDLELPDNDSGASTVRGYLVALLTKLWERMDGFSGKRPFGSSSWDCDIYVPMIKAGFILGTVDEDGYIEEMDEEAGERLVVAAIDHLGKVD